MDSCIPRYKNVKNKKNIYMTPEAIRKKDLKNRLWRRYKGSGCDYDRSRCTKVKNELRSLTRKLRMQFEKGIAENIKVSPKKFWSYVKSKTKTKSKIPILMKMDGSEAVTAPEKAETLNSFFSSNFTEENLELPNDDTPFLGEYLDAFTITPQMVLNKLRELNPGKTPGPDGWHPYFLKSIADIISIPLSCIFQKSTNEGVVPSQWLQACITAIHKKRCHLITTDH